MKATLTTPSLTIELEGGTQKELFKGVAEAQEVFGERQCGKCKSASIHFRVRTVGKYSYYEMSCIDCGAKLAFGQSLDTHSLFPIRKLTPQGKPCSKTGTYDSAGKGWTMYRGEVESE